MKITSDARVRAGVRAALKHICERHGFTKEEQRELAAAVEKECGNALENHDGPICAVTIEEREDRIEVSVDQQERQTPLSRIHAKAAPQRLPKTDCMQKPKIQRVAHSMRLATAGCARHW
ncbi:MAG: hypothetical protein WBE86_15155 [Candidatus Acidiferrales bacterium]